MSRFLLVCLGFIAVASTGCTYEGRVQCRFCDNQVETVIGTDCESEDNAKDNAEDRCIEAGGTVEGDPTSRAIFGFCSSRAAFLDGLPSYQVREFLRSRLIQAPASSNAPAVTCPAQKVNLKITFHYDYGRMACPGDPKEVQVLYEKAVGGSSEFITLSKVVNVGGHQEFICTDAKVNDGGKVATFRVAVSNQCACTIEEGCYTAQAYSQMPGDGSSLVIHESQEGGTQVPTVVPPPDDNFTLPAAVSSAMSRELRPIPDPMFMPRPR